MTRLRTEVSIAVARPVGEVFSALCEARSWPAWTRWASHVSVEPPTPIRGGSVIRVEKRGVGRRGREWHVTDIRPDRLIALEDDGGERRFWLHLEPEGEATVITARTEFPARTLMPALRRRSEEVSLRADLRRLRAVLESAAGVTPLLARHAAVEPGAPVTSLEAARRGH